MRPPGSAAQLAYRRQLGGKLLTQGKGVREVARLLSVAPSSVSRWKQALQHGGERALQAKPHAGPTPRLSATQKRRLVATLVAGPRAAGYATEWWTCPRVGEVIHQKFGVSYHPAHVWRLLRALLWRPQKPEHWARERDEAAIARWRRQTWPRLKKSAAASGASRLPGRERFSLAAHPAAHLGPARSDPCP
jgi:transposase